MSKLLFNRPPISIDTDLASAIGLCEAVFIQQIHYWVQVKIESPSRYKDSFKNGYFWVYNSVPKWIEQMPFLGSEAKVRRFIKDLKASGIIVTSNFNRGSFDKTYWYRIDYNVLDLFMKDRSSQNDKTMLSKRQDDVVILTRPIPETTPEITSETTYKQENARTTKKQNIPFSNFWEAYPVKRGSKPGAEKKWKQLSIETQALIMSNIKNRITKDSQWIKGYIPHAVTYLNQERWLEEFDDDPFKQLPLFDKSSANPAAIQQAKNREFIQRRLREERDKENGQ